MQDLISINLKEINLATQLALIKQFRGIRATKDFTKDLHPL